MLLLRNKLICNFFFCANLNKLRTDIRKIKKKLVNLVGQILLDQLVC